MCEAGRSAGVPIVINARVDLYLRAGTPLSERLNETLRRGRKYLAAGATCVYPIGLSDVDAIALLVRHMGGPLNVWLRRGGPSLETLRRVGVARISLASAVHRSAMAHVATLAEALRQVDDTKVQALLNTGPGRERGDPGYPIIATP